MKSLDNVSANRSDFDQIALRSRSDVVEWAATIACYDQAYDDPDFGESDSYYNKLLGSLVEGTSDKNCWEVDTYCDDMYIGVSVRAMCPLTCGCHIPALGPAGFFATAAWGCPTSCMSIWSQFSETCTDHGFVPYEISAYLSGLKTYVLSRDFASQRIKSTLREYYDYCGITSDDVPRVHQYVIGDDFWGNLSALRYFIGPNITLRHLTGCQFYASAELRLLLGVDLCSTDTPITDPYDGIVQNLVVVSICHSTVLHNAAKFRTAHCLLL